jgi:hypothetical protein
MLLATEVQLPRRPSPAWLVLCAALTVLPAWVDVALPGVNLSILYFVPLLLTAAAGQRKLLIHLAILLSVLTYLGYLYGFRDVLLSEPEQIFTFRLLNRTLVVLALWVMTLTLYLGMGIGAKIGNLAANQRRSTVFAEAADALEHLIAGIVCLTLVVTVLAADLLSPGEYNLPVLYALPLILSIWMNSRRLLWGLVPVLLLFSAIGFAWGRQPHVDHEWLPKLLMNRSLAMAVLVALATILHFLIRERRTAPRV